MKIQEYACETAPQSVEFTDEAIKLIEQLGATGQEGYYKPNESPCPYRKMTKTEYAVYTACLPVKEEIDKFSAGPIPLRVLQIGAHATSMLTGTLVIWHAGVGMDDPLLTLRVGESWRGEYYLLARWADELEEFSVLFQKAVDNMTAKAKAELIKAQADFESWSRNLRDLVESRLREGKTDLPSCHWF